jgi:hypothetical protein
MKIKTRGNFKKYNKPLKEENEIYHRPHRRCERTDR